MGAWYLSLHTEIRNVYEDIPIIFFGNKKDIYDRDPKSALFVPVNVIRDFVEQTRVIYESGCALSDDQLLKVIKKMLESIQCLIQETLFQMKSFLKESMKQKPVGVFVEMIFMSQ